MNAKTPSIESINGYLESIAIINSFINDDKTYYLALLGKINNSFEDTLREHLNVKKWTFKIDEPDGYWKDILNEELLSYFGQFFIMAKKPYIDKEYEGLKNDDYAKKSREILLQRDSNIEYLLHNFIENISKLLPEKYEFYRVVVDWHSTDEGFYECYENDYLFDFGDKILFLHFGGSD